MVVYSHGLRNGFSLLVTLATLNIVTLMQNIKFAIRINLDYDLDT